MKSSFNSLRSSNRSSATTTLSAGSGVTNSSFYSGTTTVWRRYVKNWTGFTPNLPERITVNRVSIFPPVSEPHFTLNTALPTPNFMKRPIRRFIFPKRMEEGALPYLEKKRPLSMHHVSIRGILSRSCTMQRTALQNSPARTISICFTTTASGLK